jgi:2-polyprenyl-3-methyl-5-hydroxy-6-metoxy-1,4-benzoquinol methylase
MNSSGAGPRLDRPDPVVLRLLPHVHAPPARALVVGAGGGHEAKALDARGYEVSVVDTEAPPVNSGVQALAAPMSESDFGGRFDLVCVHALSGETDAPRAEACARALREGGHLFGSFSPCSTDSRRGSMSCAASPAVSQTGGWSWSPSGARSARRGGALPTKAVRNTPRFLVRPEAWPA